MKEIFPYSWSLSGDATLCTVEGINRQGRGEKISFNVPVVSFVIFQELPPFMKDVKEKRVSFENGSIYFDIYIDEIREDEGILCKLVTKNITDLEWFLFRFDIAKSYWSSLIASLLTHFEWDVNSWLRIIDLDYHNISSIADAELSNDSPDFLSIVDYSRVWSCPLCSSFSHNAFSFFATKYRRKISFYPTVNLFDKINKPTDSSIIDLFSINRPKIVRQNNHYFHLWRLFLYGLRPIVTFKPIMMKMIPDRPNPDPFFIIFKEELFLPPEFLRNKVKEIRLHDPSRKIEDKTVFEYL